MRQPVGQRPDQEDMFFHPHMVEFRRRDGEISQHVEITVALEDDADAWSGEIRRVSLTNDSDEERHLQLTSYGEVVLAAAATDRRHQAFAKLFVESEYIPDLNALLFRRRPRSATEEPRFLLHMLVVEGGAEEGFGLSTYESDRARFLGRGNTPCQPAALQQQSNGQPSVLSGTTGATLDPIMALSQELHLKPRDHPAVGFPHAGG